jgi:hypothetical protein
MSLVVWIAALGFASRQGCVASMRRYPLVLPMALLFVIGASTNVFAQSKEAATNALATRFLKEAPAAWNRIEEQTMGLSTVVEARAGHPGKSPTEILHDPKERLEILDVCVKGDNTKRQIETPKDGKRHLSVSNANYSFTLRKNGSADSAWVVTSVTGQNQRPSSQSRWNPRSDLLFARTNVCYCRLVDLVSSPAFSVQRITEESNLVRVEFKSEFDRDKQNRIVGGWIKLNPRDNWSVVQYNLEFLLHSKEKGRISGSLEYADIKQGLPFPKVLVVDQRFPSTGEMRFVYTFRDTKESTLAPADFRLASFGFPEPDNAGGRQSSVRLLLYLNGAAVLLVVGALWLRRWKRKMIMS